MQDSAINRFLKIQEEDFPDGRSRLSLQVRPEFNNEVGIPHGGITFLLLDGAMGRTVNRSLSTGESAATIQMSIQYLKVAEGLITADAKILKKGKSVVFIQGECRNSKNEIIATASGSWAIRR